MGWIRIIALLTRTTRNCNWSNSALIINTNKQINEHQRQSSLTWTWMKQVDLSKWISRNTKFRISAVNFDNCYTYLHTQIKLSLNKWWHSVYRNTLTTDCKTLYRWKFNKITVFFTTIQWVLVSTYAIWH